MLINTVRSTMAIPAISASGAGSSEHFLEVFTKTETGEAAPAAGIVHRKEVSVGEVKEYLKVKIEIRPV